MCDAASIKKLIWDGNIAISLTLAKDELNTVGIPEPYFLMIPRFFYYPLIWIKIKHYYVHLDNKLKDKSLFWLENNGKPLKWNYPIGVLYDTYQNKITKPWNLVIHFELLQYTAETIEALFFSMLKEADYLKSKSQNINSLQKKDLNQLWQSLISNDFDLFWKINCKLYQIPLPKDLQIYHLPFRIYINDEIVQNRFPFYNTKSLNHDSGNPYLAHKLTELLTFCDINSENSKQDIEKSNIIKYDFNTNSLHDNNNYHKQCKKICKRCICHGIDIPLETPLTYLYQNLSNPDNFLHLIIKS
ncbi:autophagy protein 5-like isoform X2 [Gordionus sp. m RMFG-2023]|uniref:autophagy protein 5-like isoform X2 n=1 Tax=Gordionus sp. m RMFG-2023 TaxID=3053472 RepID=UPI0031FCC9E6